MTARVPALPLAPPAPREPDPTRGVRRCGSDARTSWVTTAARRAMAAAVLLLVAACAGASPENADPENADAAAWWSPGAEATTEPPATAGSDPAAGAVGTDPASAGAALQAGAAPAVQAPLAPDGEPAPALAAPGSPPEQVWRQLTARHTWLYRHPDPAGLDLLYAPECPCLAEERERLAGLAAQGRWWTGARPELTAVEVRDASAPDLVALRATYARGADTQLVDAAGTVHQTVPPRDPIVIDIVLVREDASAPWRVRALSEQVSEPGATP